jgi:hypothetical protein
MRSSLIHGLFVAGILIFSGGALVLTQPMNANIGSISGSVVDITGNPVIEAKVYTEPLSGILQGLVKETLSDKMGRFFLANIDPGDYFILASRKEDGYPHIDFAFYATDLTAFPKITVIKGQVTSNVVVRLGKRGAMIKGRIVDSFSSLPVVNSIITLTREDRRDPPAYISFGPDENGNFTSAVPAMPFRIEVSAPGFQRWDGGILALSSNATKVIDVLLKPIGKN